MDLKLMDKKSRLRKHVPAMKEDHVVVAEDIEEVEETLEAAVEVEEDEDVDVEVIVVVVAVSVVETVHVTIAIKKVILQENALKQTAVTDKTKQGIITTKSTRFKNF